MTREQLALHEAQESLSRIGIADRPASPLGRHERHERYPSVTPSATSISEGPGGDEDDTLAMDLVDAARKQLSTKGKAKEVEKDKGSQASVNDLPPEILILVSLSDACWVSLMAGHRRPE